MYDFDTLTRIRVYDFDTLVQKNNSKIFSRKILSAKVPQNVSVGSRFEPQRLNLVDATAVDGTGIGTSQRLPDGLRRIRRTVATV